MSSVCASIWHLDYLFTNTSYWFHNSVTFRIFWVLLSVCIICSSLQCQALTIVLWIWRKPKLVGCVINRTACKRSLRCTFATNTCRWLLRLPFILCGLCVKFFVSLKLFKYNFLFLAAETAYIMPSTRVNTGQTNDSHSSVSLTKYMLYFLFCWLVVRSLLFSFNYISERKAMYI